MDKVTYVFLTLMAKIRSIMSDIADIRKSSAAGAPTKVTKASEMTDTDKNYLYLGTESGYNSGHIYYFVEGVLTDGGAYGGVNVDTTLTQSGQAADAKVTGDEIATVKEDLTALENKTGNLAPLNLFNADYADETHTFYGWQRNSIIDANTGLVVDTTSSIGTTYKIPTYGSTTVDCRYGSAQLNFTVRNMACYDINNRYLGFAALISTGYYTLKEGTAYIIIEKTYGSHPETLHNNFCVNPSWGSSGVYHVYTNPILASSLNLMQVFPKYTTIGDSLMCGFVNNGAINISSVNARAAGNNWPTYIAKRTGIDLTNVAVGGSTTGNWRSTHLDTANVDTNCYLVGLGMNDLRQSLEIGTSADIVSNFAENADSFYGNYDYIIRQLMAWKPNAHIMCFTIPSVEPHDATGYNDAIKYIASLYPDKVHVIDLTGYTSEYNNVLIAQNFIANHYNPIAYNMMSTIIEGAINTYIYYNYSLFLGAPYV